MVYTFLKKVVPDIKRNLPNVTLINYFTDGCAAQYKNRFNFINICHHKTDFEIDAIWNFFATSHGKNACDGVGGLVKRLAAKESLRRPFNGEILTATDLYKYLTSSSLSKSVKFYYIEHTNVEANSNLLQSRFDKATPIPGTQKFHKFVPMDVERINVFELSSDENCMVNAINKKVKNVVPSENPEDRRICYMHVQ
jgi:hypothetical protein